jgi:hypothetical protein
VVEVLSHESPRDALARRAQTPESRGGIRACYFAGSFVLAAALILVFLWLDGANRVTWAAPPRR